MGYTVDSLKDLFDKNIRQVILAVNRQLGEIVCELNKLKNCCDSEKSTTKIIAGTDIYITGIGTEASPYIINVVDKGYITLNDLSAIFPIQYDSLTGKFSITKASSTQDGYLSKEDWNKFNNGIDKNYVHIQSVPSNQWSIHHGLDKLPSILIMDTAGTILDGEINWITTNDVIINFNSNVAGKATLN